MLSPVISLNDLLQLAVNQPFADFSDSSDSKKKVKFFLMCTKNRILCLIPTID